VSNLLYLVKNGEHPLDRFANINLFEKATGIQSLQFKAMIKDLESKENNKKNLIDQEEFYRMELWKKIHKKDKL
jgi:hypothetical protein